MFIEPIEIELDRKRKYKLGIRTLLRAEREINRRRGAEIDRFVSIDSLMIQGARKSIEANGSFPLDLFTVILWAGLTEEDPNLTIDQIPDLLESSPLTRSNIITAIWDHYLAATVKPDKPSEAATNGAAEASPLALRPGSTSGPLQ